MTTVLSISTPQLSDVVALTKPTHEAFAELYGYQYKHIELPEMEVRKAIWKKPESVSQELLLGNNVWWIDADAAVTNPAALPHVLEERVTASCDINGINAGVFYAASCERVSRLFFACNTHGRTVFLGLTGDQFVMQHFASHPPYEGIVNYVPQRALNSYWPGAYDYPGHEAADWQPGDFVLHLPGLPNERRIEILKEALKL
jgi:hypothetical protein